MDNLKSFRQVTSDYPSQGIIDVLVITVTNHAESFTADSNSALNIIKVMFFYFGNCFSIMIITVKFIQVSL